jgi:hypothetical protein
LRPTAHQGELTGYTAALEDVWAGVVPAVAELERVAAEPAERIDDADLAGLQYALHRAAELVHGLAPPTGAEGTHDDLADALCSARDATAFVADAVDEGGSAAAEPLVWEWRGALFRVRLARRRLVSEDGHGAQPAVAAQPAGVARPLAATLAMVAGVALVLAGALAELWPLWTVGVALVLAGIPLAARP